MAVVRTFARFQQAPVPVPVQSRPPALYRIPVTLTLLGLFLVAVQAGHAVLGLAALMTALVSTAAFTWRSMIQRDTPAMVLREQGDQHLASGDYCEARVLYERALAIVQRELPAAAPEVLLNYYSLAAVNSMLRDYARADQYLQRLLEGMNHRIPFTWAGNLAWLMRRVAHHHSMEGRHRRALDLCEQAIDTVGEAPGADDNTVRSLLDDLAWIRHHAGEYAKAETHFREALGVHEQFRDIAIEIAQRRLKGVDAGSSPYRAPGPAIASTTGGLDRAVAYSLLGLGWTVYERGAYAESRQLFGRAALMTSACGPEARVLADVPGLLVEVLRGQAAVEMTLGNYAVAAALYERAVEHTPQGVASMQSAALAIDLGWLARCRSQFDKAEEIYEQVSRQIQSDSGGRACGLACALYESLAELRRRQGRFREAGRQIQKATELAERCLGSEHPRRAAILAIRARILSARSDFTDGERDARHCLRILKATLGDVHPRLADGYVALGEVLLGRGQLGAAKQAFANALERRESTLGPHHPELVEILEGQLAVLRAAMDEDEASVTEQRLSALRERLATA